MKYTIATMLMLFTSMIVNAQDYDFGKVDISEVEKNTYDQDTSASAVVLYKNRKTYCSYEHPDGWVVITEIQKRVKILNKDGLDYATEKVRLYKTKKSKEKISYLKGMTYNIEGGNLQKEKLKKSAVFSTEVSSNYDEESFTMPNVKVGSVVEWTYKVTSPFWKIDDLVIQEDIPTEYYLAKIQVPEYFNFKKMVRGGFTIYPNEYMERRKMKVSYEASADSDARHYAPNSQNVRTRSLTKETKTREIEVREKNTEYDLVNIPALKKEPYVNNLNNYRLVVTHELMSVIFPGGGNKVYSTTWDDVIKTINENDDFGGQLKKGKVLKDDAAALKAMSNNQLELTAAAYSFIQNKMNWNGNYGKFCDDGIQKAYKETTGDVPEINLMLVALLRECGIKANPVLISTRKHGIPVFPTIDGFNYVVVCAEINGRDILLDATEKNMAPGLLPPRALNWEGTLVKDDGTYRKINLFPSKASKFDVMMSIELDEDGTIKGKRRANISDLDAFSFRNTYKNVSQDERIEKLINDNDFGDVYDYEIKNMNAVSKPVTESYSFELDDAVDLAGDEIYLSPLLQLALSENPFKSDDRIYPVDFVYPQSRKKMVTIKIPEGYQVASLPEPIKLSLPNNLGSFLFNISESPSGLSLMTDFKMNSAIIPTGNYIELKEFYNKRIAKEAEKVLLIKK